MKIEVFGSGAYIEVPNIESQREANRVGFSMLAYTREKILPLFPVQYQDRAARFFAKEYTRQAARRDKQTGGPLAPFKCVKNANAELKVKARALSTALAHWKMPLDAMYSPSFREREARALYLGAKRMAAECGGDEIEIYQSVCEFFINAGLSVPTLKKDGSNLSACVRRLLCEDWISNKVERLARLCRENVAIAWGEVTKKTPYISQGGLKAYRAQVAAGEEFLKNVLLVNDALEETVLLGDAAEQSASNAHIREIELNVRVDGLTQWAERNGLDSYFLTMTAPSKYHYNSGKKWCGAMPRDVQARLVDVWALVRAKLAKSGIAFRGLRVVEPHKDACPHWHMLIFFNPSETARALKIIGDEFCREDAHELDTAKKRKARFDAVKLENAKHAARYVAKYISKNLSGETMMNGAKASDAMDHETDLDIVSASERVRAWASFHTIRQFQFFGIESVTVFREIRRLRIENASEEVQALIDATGGVKGDDKNPDWYAFEKLAGKCDLIKSESQSRYGEPTKKVKGVLIAGERFITRVGEWMQEQLTPALRAALKTGGSPFTWKVVNKCNPIAGDSHRMVSEGLLVPLGNGNFKLREASFYV